MTAEGNRSPDNPQRQPRRSVRIPDMKESILSPGFRSAAAMVGSDQEAILHASLVVEDTPVRESRHKKRTFQQFKSPPRSTKFSGNRISRRRSLAPIPPVILCLDDVADDDNGGIVKKDLSEKKEEMQTSAVDEEKNKVQQEGASDEKASGKGLACMDRLREELSCAVCLEICFEPSTTPCGHSFCKKCLRRAAHKCGKRCPKCRQLISNGRSCTVNTVLWNTIQLLFHEEVEERKKATSTAPLGNEAQCGSPASRGNIRNSATSSTSRSSAIRSATQVPRAMDRHRTIRGAAIPSQSEDAALALRIQREEYMEAFQENHEPRRDNTLDLRANLGAISSTSRSSAIRSATQVPRAMDRHRAIRGAAIPSQSEDAALALRLQREEYMEAFQENCEPRRDNTLDLRSNL